MPRLASPRSQKRPRLEIIPFIDIMFFLLATFMMVSLSLTQSQNIPIHLPTAQTSQTSHTLDPITLTVNKNGALFWDKQGISHQVLKNRLNSLQTAPTPPQILISGDAEAPFESVIGILDEVRKAGLTKIAIKTTLPQR